ncbi:hypothetical protein QBC36DRAFT_368960 [Triangularia setosa]|uniref:Alkyl hydroperoxide reductase subunit C/ Thiol specific antioxidant domain-containing protein n=1 Tax=Triangularia setosa TaxID=2587417 RepID=A0AAN6WCV8_9PEZI|nr:hypothetical protein QBC36DRAFT_368960 [Podospora setosa]
MFSGLAQKAALKKIGLPSDTFSQISNAFNNDTSSSSPPPRQTNKLRKSPPDPNSNSNSNNTSSNKSWFSVSSLPLTVQPWLSPPPPPVSVSKPPRIGDVAPVDPDRLLSSQLGPSEGNRKTIVVFLRCVGCAFAQQTFVELRTLSIKHRDLVFLAISHSSPAATEKWVSLIGGKGNVKLVYDPKRTIYASWGLGTGGWGYLLNVNTQVNGFKTKGWLGTTVAASVERTEGFSFMKKQGQGQQGGVEEGMKMGNKWQEAGGWAVDGKGRVVWGGKLGRADESLGLEEGVKLLKL